MRICSHALYDSLPPEIRQHLTPTHAVDGDTIYEIAEDAFPRVLTPANPEMTLIPTVIVPEGTFMDVPYSKIRRVIKLRDDKWAALDEKGGRIMLLTAKGVQELRKAGGF